MPDKRRTAEVRRSVRQDWLVILKGGQKDFRDVYYGR